MLKPLFLFVCCALVCAQFLCTLSVQAGTHHVGQGQTFANIADAAAIAQPGDTILMHSGTYTGGQTFSVQGTADAWIHIAVAANSFAIVEGGTECWHLTDAQYVRISDIVFRSSSSNLINIDDGGSYDTPAHHIVIDNCTFANGNPDNGNADMLKMSGVDNFSITHCSFTNNRSPSGSGIDMVGCHEGVIAECVFREMGSNSIQAKGGTRAVRVERCLFQDGGARAINMGGSTGEAFFRPIDINYEASHLDVFSCVFIDSGPVAFVGCVQSRVVNNTFLRPQGWALRILQETTRDGFLQCADNTFRNNILYFGADVADYAINVGPNTQPETFVFSNNLWFNADDPSWSGPNWPVVDVNAVVADPKFTDIAVLNLSPAPNSPARSAGLSVDDPSYDFNGVAFATPRSIGAVESTPSTGVQEPSAVAEELVVVPNPTSGVFTVRTSGAAREVGIYTLDGREVQRIEMPYAEPSVVTRVLPPGLYLVTSLSGNAVPRILVVIQ